MKHPIAIARTVLSVSLLLLASACGKEGPLQLVPSLQPGVVTSFQVRQSGTDLVLEWAFPAQYGDHKTPLDLSRVESVTVMLARGPLGEGQFSKKAKRYGRFPAAQLTRRGEREVALRLPFELKELAGGHFYFSVAYRVGRHLSPPSEVAEVAATVPAAAITDLAATREKKTVILRWTPPLLTLGKTPLASAMGFRVYRRIGQGGTFAPYRLLTPDPIPTGVYEDDDTGQSGAFEYRVVTVSAPRVESAFSNPAGLEIADTFPPEVPTRLISFRGPGSVLLTWERVADSDFAFFRLYRKTCRTESFELLADKLAENSYRDLKLDKKCTYQYYVTAVDRQGNESDPTPTVQETLE